MILGGFYAYVYQPQPKNKGVVLQLFAENGTDGDRVLLMGASQYVEQKLHIVIHHINDKDGFSLAKNSGQYPKILECDVTIKPSKNKKYYGLDGYLTQFFAESGSNADLVLSTISQSQYLDSLVHVTVCDGLDSHLESNIQNDLNQNFYGKVSLQDHKSLAELDKKFKQANQYLTEIIHLPSLHQVIEKHYPLTKFASGQKCVYRNADMVCECDAKQLFRNVPMCDQHAQMFQTNETKAIEGLQGKAFYLELKQKETLANWVSSYFHQQFNTPYTKEMDSVALLAYLKANRLDGCCDPKFIYLAEQISTLPIYIKIFMKKGQ